MLKDMSVVLNLVGCVSSPLICFTFPAIFYLKTVPDISYKKRFFLKYFMICLMIILGLYGVSDFIFGFSLKIYNY